MGVYRFGVYSKIPEKRFDAIARAVGKIDRSFSKELKTEASYSTEDEGPERRKRMVRLGDAKVTNEQFDQILAVVKKHDPVFAFELEGAVTFTDDEDEEK